MHVRMRARGATAAPPAPPRRLGARCAPRSRPPCAAPPAGSLPWRGATAAAAGAPPGGGEGGDERDERKQWVLEAKEAAMARPGLYLGPASGGEGGEGGGGEDPGLPGGAGRGRAVGGARERGPNEPAG